MMTRSRHVLVALVLVVAGAGAACGDDDTTRTTGASTTGPPGPRSTLVTLDVHGGFVPVERAVGDTAEVVVHGDGTVLSPAPVPAIFPGPALTPFQVGHVHAAEVAALAEDIEALDPDADYGQRGDLVVADAPDTTVRLVRAGRDDVAITANALGREGESGPRAQLAAVVERIQALGGSTGEEHYEPTALRVHDVTDLAGDPPDPEAPPVDPGAPAEPSGRILDWPLAHDGRSCVVVDDRALVEAALAVLADATELDWFRTDAGVRRLVVAPLLPGDEGCPDD